MAAHDTSTPPAARTGFWARYRGMILQAVLLMAIWLVLSGHYDFLHIFFGVISVALVVWMNAHLRSLPLAGETCGASCIRLDRLAIYLVWLVKEIFKSGFYVAWVVIKPVSPISPSMVRFTSKQPNAMARMILGNSITLTPGTVTVDIKDDTFIVHALTDDTAAGLVSGDMESRVAKLYCGDISGEDACGNVCTITTRKER